MFVLEIYFYPCQLHLFIRWSFLFIIFILCMFHQASSCWIILGHFNYHQVSDIRHFSRQLKCWSLRCSWSIAYRRCSNYIFILHLAPIYCAKTTASQDEKRKLWDLVRLIFEILRYKLFVFELLLTHVSCIYSFIFSNSSLSSHACFIKHQVVKLFCV